MNFKAKFMFLSSVSVLFYSLALQAEKAPFGTCDPQLLNALIQSSKKDPHAAFLYVTRIYIPTMTKDSYRNQSIKEEDLAQWINFLACFYEFIDSLKPVKEQYKKNIIEFYSISMTIYYLANRLYGHKQKALLPSA